MMACVSGSGPGIDEIKNARPFASPSEKVLGVLSHCRFFQSTAVSHQPRKRRRQDVLQRNVWQGSSLGEIWRSLADAAHARRRRFLPSGELKVVVVHTRPVFGRIVSDGGMVPISGTYKNTSGSPFDIIPFSACGQQRFLW